MDDYVCICNMRVYENETHTEFCQVYNKGRLAERDRIVGLFDAEEEQISEQDWTNNSMKRLDAHQRIIEGLRVSPTEQTDGK
jgi:hypothetical protein